MRQQSLRETDAARKVYWETMADKLEAGRPYWEASMAADAEYKQALAKLTSEKVNTEKTVQGKNEKQGDAAVVRAKNSGKGSGSGGGKKARSESSSGGGNGENSGSDGIFGDIDPDLLIKLLDIVSRLSENDANTAFLTALRPLLREENRQKLDRAARIMKLMSILPLLSGSGIADGLFR